MISCQLLLVAYVQFGQRLPCRRVKGVSKRHSHLVQSRELRRTLMAALRPRSPSQSPSHLCYILASPPVVPPLLQLRALSSQLPSPVVPSRFHSPMPSCSRDTARHSDQLQYRYSIVFTHCLEELCAASRVSSAQPRSHGHRNSSTHIRTLALVVRVLVEALHRLLHASYAPISFLTSPRTPPSRSPRAPSRRGRRTACGRLSRERRPCKKQASVLLVRPMLTWKGSGRREVQSALARRLIRAEVSPPPASALLSGYVGPAGACHASGTER